MKIAAIIFTFKRSVHTKKVLDALRENDRLPDKLLLFQDGLADESDRKEWEAVGQMIQAVDWCDCDAFIADGNKGLADSIVAGVEYAFRSYDAVIVLEDDCVVHPQFMEYMMASLNKYKERKEIYSVSGYAWPVAVESNGSDAYFTQRISSFGWGTWKDRWVSYQRDYRILGRMKKNSASAERLSNWGGDLEYQLLGNIYGRCNSWAVFWALTVIARNGFCLAPYESLVDNIGYDGTGVHCGFEKVETTLRARDNRKQFLLPDEIKISKETKKAFARYFSRTPRETKLDCYNQILAAWVRRLQKKESMGEALLEKGIKKISIWGKGQLCDLLLAEISNKVEVLSIIESKPRSESYQGIPITTIENLPEESQKIIVIPVYDMDEILEQVDEKYQDRVIGIAELLEHKTVIG